MQILVLTLMHNDAGLVAQVAGRKGYNELLIELATQYDNNTGSPCGNQAAVLDEIQSEDYSIERHTYEV